jgi:uncharacterized protein (TIGR01777 family)
LESPAILLWSEGLMRTLVTGATGLLGRALLRGLDGVVILCRDPARARLAFPGIEAHAWSATAAPPPADALREIDVVFNLAGEPLAEGRWTQDKKRRIRDSRVLGTRNLVAGLAARTSRPRVLVSASAVGYYGDRGDEELDEMSSPGRGFLADVCAEWEAEAMAAEALGIRVICVRFGIVLAPGGGALAKMLPPFRLGVGGKLGDGGQWMSFVHIDDAIGILLHASRQDSCRRAVNAVAPVPVTNTEFTRTLGRALHRPAFLAVPEAALRLALGEMSGMLTTSQRVFPRLAERTGYTFQYRDLAAALAAVLTAQP